MGNDYNDDDDDDNDDYNNDNDNDDYDNDNDNNSDIDNDIDNDINNDIDNEITSLRNSNVNCFRVKQSRLSERFENMRTTSEPTPGWRKLRAFTKLPMRPLLRAMRTKCTR